MDTDNHINLSPDNPLKVLSKKNSIAKIIN